MSQEPKFLRIIELGMMSPSSTQQTLIFSYPMSTTKA